MKDTDQERRVLQDKMNLVEGELDAATCENLKLKGLSFEMDYKIGSYSMLVEQL